MAQDYPVILVNPNNLADTLDLGDGTNYITNSAGLHDLPALAPILSDGYALGSVYVDTHYQPRQFSLTVTIRAGLSTGRPMRNAAHNTARDQLLRFLRKGRPVIVRTTYIGLGTWDILAIVQQVQWQPGTSIYVATLIAPDPRLISTTPQTQTEHLSSGSEHDFTLDAAGNCETRPTLTITPTAPKTNTWQYRRIYTVQNPTDDTDLKSEPVGLPFDFQWHITNGRITSDGHDIRVLFNRAYIDRWFGLFTAGGGDGFIWVELDIPAGDTVTVEVIYGPNVTETWTNKTAGPMFDLDLSSNNVAHYLYTFMDVPGRPSTRTRQWNVHYAQSTGISAIVRHLFSPWHGSGTDTGTVNAAAGEVPLATRILGYAGLALHHPLKIDSVTFSGYSQQTPTHEKLVLRALRPDISEEDDWELDDDTHTVLTAFGPFTVSFAEARLAIVFAMRSLSEHQEDLTPIAGADDVAISIANPLVVTGASTGTSNEEQIYMLQLRLWSRDTGTEIDLWNGFVTYNSGGGHWNSVTVDLETQALLMGPDNDSMIYALVLAPDVRGDYWWLEPGVNNLALSDAGTSGLDVAFAWQSARL